MTFDILRAVSYFHCMDGHSQRSRSRASTESYFNPRTGEFVERHIRDSDIDLLKLFARHRYLSAPYAAALLNRSEQGVSRRLRSLKEKDVGLVKLCETQREDRNLRTVGFLYYDIDAAGITLLAEEGVHIVPPKAPKNFVHALMVHQIIASFAIGAVGRDDIRIVYEDNQRLLLGQRNGKDHYMISDYPRFAIERTADGKRREIPSIEADTASEPIESYDRERSAICNKFDDYIYALENGLFQKQYDVRTFFIPFITRNERRMQSMMDCLAAKTERKKELRRYFLFKTHPTLKSRENPRASGHMLTEPWKRVGNADLYLDKENTSARQQTDQDKDAH
ncbi:LysR family transcriptional regulator [Bradyrhizobium sp.]|uniref:helix-turn-helix domain-containing protein n=1 Tax=Bradyrhizobium sp. TaxID=376 RepID=UPI00273529A6|nr:LysR family transcriptional regulator [Bradyrhizobium sp.]MDP3074747.1 LysR family transcriptional regulator [Bradyrhizobium sp.]